MGIDTGPAVTTIGRRLLPGCLWHGDRTRPVVALTFDDGPDPDHTPGLLDVLARHRVAATFFWIGWRVRREPELARRVVAEGHAIGLHGERHKSFWGRSASGVLAELDAMREAFGEVLGGDQGGTWLVRPPYGQITPGQARRLGAAGYRVVECDVLPGDWAASSDVVIRRIMKRAKCGSIIALHDGNTAGPQVARTVDAVVPALRERGFGFVTIPELERGAS